MKRNKVATSSVASGRAKVDRAETYPGGRNETGPDEAQRTDNYRRYNSSSARVSSTSSGGNNVMKWFKYITDAAESYKSKDNAKSKKPVHQPTGDIQTPGESVGGGGGGGGGGSSPLYETTKSVANGSRRQENGGGEDGEAEATAGYIPRHPQQLQQPGVHAWRRVEASQFKEEPVLVQPDEVKVCLTKVVNQHSDATGSMSPLDLIKEKNRMIEVTLVEKRNLVANILQIPFQSYDHICEVVDETRTSTDIRELMLSSLTQADLLTQLINDQLDAKLVVREDQSTLVTEGQGRSFVLSGADDPKGSQTFDTGSIRSSTRAALSRSVAFDQNLTELADQQLEEQRLDLRSDPDCQQIIEELPIVVPSSRLIAISNRLSSNLTQLMELVQSRDREIVSWETELSQCNDHLRQLTSQGHRVTGTSPGEHMESSAEQHGEYVTSSWEAVPVRTEHLEVIEANRIIEPERVVTLAPNLLPGSVTVAKMPGGCDVMPSSSDARRKDS